MKIIIVNYTTRAERERTMEIVKNTNKGVFDVLDTTTPEFNNTQFIHLQYKKGWYRFDRFDPEFITSVRHANDTNPYNHWPSIKERFFYEVEIDDRFTDERYYTIERPSPMRESIVVHTDKIIDDLHDGTYLRNN